MTTGLGIWVRGKTLVLYLRIDQPDEHLSRISSLPYFIEPSLLETFTPGNSVHQLVHFAVTMTSNMKSRAERIESVRASLGPQSRLSNKPQPAENLFVGIALHAASRKSKGLELSELEAKLVGSFSLFADDEEISDYGRIFDEAKSQKGTLSTIFPTAVTILSEEQSYTKEDFKRDIKSLIPEITAQSNHQIVDLTKLDGDCVDTEEYISAVSQAGGGVTIFTAGTASPAYPASEESSNVKIETSHYDDNIIHTKEPMHTKLVFDRFKCHRRSGELGHDEIYWGYASGADDNTGKHVMTREYGSISTGSQPRFDANTILFEGNVLETLTGHIECWEADDSSGGWYNSFRDFLRNASEYCIDAAVDAAEEGGFGDEEGATEWAAAVLALAAIVGALLSQLLGLIRNDDDLVFKRDFGFSRNALIWFWSRPNQELSMMFDGGGGGKHELWIRRIFDDSKSTMGKLVCRKPDGQISSVADTKSPTGLTVVEFNGILYALFSNFAGTLCVASTSTGATWNSPVTLRQLSRYRPAAVVYRGQIHVACTTETGRPYLIRSDDPLNAASWEQVAFMGSEGTATSDTPMLVVLGDSMFALHQGNDYYRKAYWVMTSDPTSWDWQPVPVSLDSLGPITTVVGAPGLCWSGRMASVLIAFNLTTPLTGGQRNMLEIWAYEIIKKEWTHLYSFSEYSASSGLCLYDSGLSGSYVGLCYASTDVERKVNTLWFKTHDPSDHYEEKLEDTSSMAGPVIFNYNGGLYYAWSDLLS